jgi:hypothetical protein
VGFEKGLIRWRANSEKTGNEHITPEAKATMETLAEARAANPGPGETSVLPAQKTLLSH